MGVDLVRGRRCYTVNAPTWWALMTVAIGCGWDPRGTGPPRGVLRKNWSGGYFSNDGQRFYCHDARRLAAVLQSVGEHSMEGELRLDRKRISRWLRGVQGRSSVIGLQTYRAVARVLNKRYSARRDEASHIRALLTKDGRLFLREFVRFCRGGSFRIY